MQFQIPTRPLAGGGVRREQYSSATQPDDVAGEPYVETTEDRLIMWGGGCCVVLVILTLFLTPVILSRVL